MFSYKNYGFSKKNLKTVKHVKVANLLYNATGKVSVLERFKMWFLFKNYGFFKKILSLFKIAKNRNFAVEWDWNSQVPQSVQKFGSSFEKNGFPKKNMRFWKSLEVAVLLSNETERLKSRKIFKTYVLWKRIAAFSEKSWNFSKTLRVAKLLQNAIKTVRFVKTLETGFYRRKERDGFSRRKSFVFWE